MSVKPHAKRTRIFRLRAGEAIRDRMTYRCEDGPTTNDGCGGGVAVSQNCTVVGSFRADGSDRDRDKELPILERHGK